jgi:hypothetical protein
MGTSRDWYRPRLYRKPARAVTFTCIAAGLGLLISTFAAAQFAKKRKPDTGPRAIGLLKIDAKGRAQLIPVAIRIDGKFYDAGAYKADPVPMALQPDIVYEGFRAGVSQGLFTTAGAAKGQDSWFADGKWRTNTQIEAAKAKAKAESEKKAQKASDEPVNGGPPRLRHPGDAPPPNPAKAPDSQKTPSPAPAGSAAPSPAAAPSASSTSPPKDSPAKDSSSKDSPPKPDADRPVLRRQEQSEVSHEQTKITPDDIQGPFQWVPAISDDGGPEPRPYSYDMKPDEEAAFLKKMLAMAGQEVTARAGRASEQGAEPKSKASDKNVRPTRSPQFTDVHLRVFDLSNSNEPVLILTANATVPSRADVVFMIALVAREDIYGDLHKVSALLTDSQHLDAQPKYEFIDAVDADGDGRAELLFRLTSDAGSAYAIYSVIGDKLWPLFEGKPGT